MTTIKNEALRTSRLLNDMLTLLSCDTGHLDIKPVRAQLDTLLLNACEAFEKTKIFDRFYRSEKARSDKNHFGLGLSIAYDIITAHHGSIKVTDTPGGGTTFLILLRSQSV